MSDRNIVPLKPVLESVGSVAIWHYCTHKKDSDYLSLCYVSPTYSLLPKDRFQCVFPIRPLYFDGTLNLPF